MKTLGVQLHLATTESHGVPMPSHESFQHPVCTCLARCMLTSTGVLQVHPCGTYSGIQYLQLQQQPMPSPPQVLQMLVSLQECKFQKWTEVIWQVSQKRIVVNTETKTVTSKDESNGERGIRSFSLKRNRSKREQKIHSETVSSSSCHLCSNTAIEKMWWYCVTWHTVL